jgi:putative transposase
MSEKYAVITAHRTQFAVVLMCRALAVSTAGYYAAQRRAPSAHATQDAALRTRIADVFHAKQRRYGAPRVHRELRAHAIHVGQKRVARLMQEDGLQARRRRAFVPTTVRDPQHAVVPNTLDRAFDIDAHACNAVWVSDITYIPTWSGMLYLAIVLDLASRRVVGWATSASLDTRLPLTALERALAQRQPPQGLLHHSDRGSQYTSQAYRACLAAHGHIASMSRRGNCWDNAVAESFFATLEWELLDDAVFATHHAANRALVQFIDTWYNQERMHSALGYKSPAQYEQDLLRTPQAA